MNVRVFHDWLHGGRLVLLLLVALLVRPPAAGAYSCFYELNATCRLGGLQQRLAGHIDAATGAYLGSFAFNVVPNVSSPITAGFVYNSGDASLGPYGPGTSTPQDWFIVQSPVTGNYTLVGPGNVEYPFTQYNATTGQYTDTFDPFLLGASLVLNYNGPWISSTQQAFSGYTLTRKNGSKWTFDSSGGLIQSVDGYGNGINITRDATTGFVTQATAIASGASVSYDLADDYNGNHYVSVKSVYPGGASHTWTCAYDNSLPSGYRKLISLTAPDGGVWRYAYSGNYYRPGTSVSLMPVHTLTDPLGHTAMSLTWDSSGRMTAAASPAGTITFSWNAAYGSNGTVTRIDPRGHSLSTHCIWLANHFGYISDTVTDNTLGETTTTGYANYPGTNYLPTSVTDFRRRVRTYTWDNSTGHLLSRSWTTPLLATATESFGYNSTSGGLTSSTDALGRTTTNTVDACGCTMTTTNPRGNMTSLARDTHGNVTAVTNALHQTTSNTYSSSGELLTTIDPLNHTTTRTYDSYLRPATVQDANGKTVSSTYDSMDRWLTASQTVNGQTLTTTNGYDLNGNRVKLTDPKSQVWQWSFDAANRAIQATDPLAKSIATSYDGDGNISTVVDRAGNTAAYSFDTADRLLTKTFTKVGGAPDSTVNYSYNATTHLLASLVDNVASGNQTWSYVRDSLDRTTQVSTPNGTIYIGLNDKINRRETMQAGSQGTITYGYDPDDNRTSILQSGATATLTYDQLDRLSQQSLPASLGPVTTAWSFDSAGFLSSITSQRSGTTLDSHTYLRDAVGNITQETLTGASNSTSTFGYDDLYRLTSATVAGTGYSWSYDPVGNRTAQTVGGVNTSYTVDAADHLTAVNGAAVVSDANGNVLQDDLGGAYAWDVRGRLTGLVKGGSTYGFLYGPDGLRLNKTVNGALTTYLLDGNQVVTDTINGTPYQTLYGPGTDHPLARNGEFFLPNSLGSTSLLTDSSGNAGQSYQYRPFGELLGGTTDSNPFQYTGACCSHCTSS
jgi:YD repeat-containing protein